MTVGFWALPPVLSFLCCQHSALPMTLAILQETFLSPYGGTDKRKEECKVNNSRLKAEAL